MFCISICVKSSRQVACKMMKLEDRDSRTLTPLITQGERRACSAMLLLEPASVQEPIAMVNLKVLTKHGSN